MNNQTFTIHWRMVEDFPTKDGEYIVCHEMRDGTYGDPCWLTFEKGEWSVHEWGDHIQPAYWTDLPLPR